MSSFVDDGGHAIAHAAFAVKQALER